MAAPIKVALKFNKHGVGDGQAEFPWWDHLYNKAASKIVVNNDVSRPRSWYGGSQTVLQDGVVESRGAPVVISSKPPSASVQVVGRGQLYGAFVKVCSCSV